MTFFSSMSMTLSVDRLLNTALSPALERFGRLRRASAGRRAVLVSAGVHSELTAHGAVVHLTGDGLWRTVAGIVGAE